MILFANIDSLHQQTPNRNVYRSGFLGVQPINVISKSANSLVRQNLDRLKNV
jgi:hypothetical protein